MLLQGSTALYKRLKGTASYAVDKLTRSVYRELVGERDSVKDREERSRKAKGKIFLCRRFKFQKSRRILKGFGRYSRLIKPVAGAKFKKLRFEVYSLEKRFLKYAAA